jgi:Ca-activated chloride channel family protein
MFKMRFMGRVIAGKWPGVWRGMLALLVCASVAQAQERRQVAIELLLALDSSASMSAAEFELQLGGLAAAFRDPAVHAAIKDLEPLGVAIGVTQWGGPGESRIVVPFAHIRSAREAKAFGYRISLGSRTFYAASTAISEAIHDGIALLDANEFVGQRRTIDISGDGLDNGGGNLNEARELALAAGITIYGLAIESEEQGLTQYYRDNVITGAESFVVTAKDFADFARAIREKLIRELRPLGS